MANQKPKYKGSKYTTPIGRASYPAIFEPKLKFQTKTGEKEYTIDVLFKKGEDLSQFNKSVNTALEEVFGADKKKWPTNISYPLKLQDELIEKAQDKGQAHDHYEKGAYYAKFKTNAKNGAPVIVDHPDCNAIIDPTEIYGGCFVRVSGQIKVNVIPGTKTVYCTPYLGGVQKVKDGDSFGGGKFDAESAFEPVTFDADENLTD